jgi:hypothetical protein
MLVAGQVRTWVNGDRGTKRPVVVVVVVVKRGKTKTMPAGRKRMERGVPRESGVVTVMEEGAGVRSGIHEEMMKDEGSPGQLVLVAVNQVIQFDNFVLLF